MKTIFLCLCMALLIPGVALAKRAPAPKVPPVVFKGTRYVAPNDDGRRGYLEVWDVATNTKRGILTIFLNPIDPKKEEDVQWVFIKSMKMEDGKLAVTAENGKVYRLILDKQDAKPKPEKK